jgi:hypothetical protein
MEHEIDRAFDIEGFRNVVLDEAECWNSVEMGDVPGVAGDEIIERDHMEAVGQQAIDQVGADEAGTAGDQCGLAFEVLGGSHGMGGSRGKPGTLPPVVACPDLGQNRRRQRKEVSSGQHQWKRLNGVMDRKFRGSFNKK